MNWKEQANIKKVAYIPLDDPHTLGLLHKHHVEQMQKAPSLDPLVRAAKGIGAAAKGTGELLAGGVRAAGEAGAIGIELGQSAGRAAGKAVESVGRMADKGSFNPQSIIEAKLPPTAVADTIRLGRDTIGGVAETGKAILRGKSPLTAIKDTAIKARENIKSHFGNFKNTRWYQDVAEAGSNNPLAQAAMSGMPGAELSYAAQRIGGELLSPEHRQKAVAAVKGFKDEAVNEYKRQNPVAKSNFKDVISKLKKKAAAEKILGGLADGMPDSKFNKKQIAKGVKAEGDEHTNSKSVAKEIAKDHLVEDPKYYDHLKKMEAEHKTASARKILNKLAYSAEDAERVTGLAEKYKPNFLTRVYHSKELGGFSGLMVPGTDWMRRSGGKTKKYLQNLASIGNVSKKRFHGISGNYKSTTELPGYLNKIKDSPVSNFLINAIHGKKPSIIVDKGSLQNTLKKLNPKLPELDNRQSSMLHSIAVGHELDELDHARKGPSSFSSDRFGHHSPGVIYRESNRIATLPEALKPAGEYMSYARNLGSKFEGNRWFNEIDPRLSYGKERFSRHAIRRLSEIAERKAVTGK